MRLRAADAGDAALLSQAHAFGFDPPWPPVEIAALFAAPGAFGFLAQTADRPVGMLICRVVADEAEILTIAVDPAARGSGVGAALVRAGLDRARAAGAASVFLEAAVDNAPALALYARAGFQRIAVRSGYYDRGDAGRADAAVMRLDFPPASA